MKFTKGSVRLVDKRTYDKGDKVYKFLKVADTATFENCEMLLSNECNFDNLEIGRDYKAEISIDGRYTNISLMPLATK